jgi:hypothetical protein
LRICTLAESLDQAVQQGDFEPLLGLAKLTTFECPGEHLKGAPDPLCENAQQGEQRRGVDLYIPFTSAAMSVDQLRDFLTETRLAGLQHLPDQFGPAHLRLVAIRCPTDCVHQFDLVFAALGSDGGATPVRLFRAFSFYWPEGTEPGFSNASFYWEIYPEILQVMVGRDISQGGRLIPWRP